MPVVPSAFSGSSPFTWLTLPSVTVTWRASVSAVLPLKMPPVTVPVFIDRPAAKMPPVMVPLLSTLPLKVPSLMVPLFLTASWKVPFSMVPLFSTEFLNVPFSMRPGPILSTSPWKVPPRMPLLLNTLPLNSPPVMAVGLPTKTLHFTAEPSPMVLKSYSPPVWLLPVRSSMSPLVGSFLMYSQPSPLQGFLPPSESFGQPFSMTRSVLVIALFSTTSSSGMVKVTVVLSLP